MDNEISLKKYKEIYKKYDGKYGDLVQKHVNLSLGFDVLMNYFDCIPERERHKVDQALKELGL